MYFKNDGGPTFGETYNYGCEFFINYTGKSCYDKNGCVDSTGSIQCYDYGIGRKYVLAGKYYFRILDYEVFELEFYDQ